MKTRAATTAWIKSGRPYGLMLEDSTLGSRICVTYEDQEGHRCCHLSRRINQPSMRECGHEALRWLREMGVAAEKAAGFATRNFGLRPDETGADFTDTPQTAGHEEMENAPCSNML